MFFDDWAGPLRIATVAPLAYAALLLTLRLSGKRTLAKMNAFDLVVTISLGSTLASIITSAELPLVEGVLALTSLVVLQLAVAWTSRRSSTVAAAIKSGPQVLFRSGEFLTPVLFQERVLESEVLQAVRSQGILDLEQVAAVVLESDGSFSVLKKSPGVQRSTLRDVAGATPSSRERTSRHEWVAQHDR